MPPRIVQGPVTKRRVTDIACCICFAIFLIAFFAIGIVYAILGKNKGMFDTLDSTGQICGKDDKVKDFPYVYMTKFTEKYKSVCVKECPKFDYNQIKYNSTGVPTKTDFKPLYYNDLNLSLINRAIDRAIKSDDDDFKSLGFNSDVANGLYTKEQYEAYVNNYKVDCSPNSDVTSCKNGTASNMIIYDSRPGALDICMPISAASVKLVQIIDTFQGNWFEDVKTAKWMIIISIFTAVILSLIFLVLSAILMALVIWLQLIIAIVLCILLSVIFFVMAFADHSQELKNNGADPNTIKNYNSLRKYKWWLFTFGMIFAVLALILILYVALNLKKIKSTSLVLKFGNSRLMKSPMLFLIAMFIFALQLLLFFAGMFFMGGVYNFTSKDKSSVGAPFRDSGLGWHWISMIVLLLSWIWLLIFINNLGDYMTSAIVAEQYFDKHGCCSAMCATVIYHMGSVALASCVLLPCSIIQLLYGWIYDLITKSADEKGEATCLQKVFSKICICFKYPYKKWIMRTGEQGFTLGYIASCNFCPASKEAFYLKQAYEATLGEISVVSFIYRLSGVLAITFINTWIAQLVFTYLPYYEGKFTNILVPIGVVFVLSLVLSSLFMNALNTVTEAALICYLIELDAGATPRDRTLNNFLRDMANREADEAKLLEFQKAGGKHMGSNYEPLYDDGYS